MLSLLSSLNRPSGAVSQSRARSAHLLPDAHPWGTAGVMHRPPSLQRLAGGPDGLSVEIRLQFP